MTRLRQSLLAVAFLAQGCHSHRLGSEGTAPRPIEVVFAADQLGYLSPCGCSEHQLGGAARAAAFLEKTSKTGPTLLIEGGNLLFGKLDPGKDEHDQLQAKALALAKSWAKATAGTPRALRVGPYDLSLGADFAAKALSATPPLDAVRWVDVDGVRIGLLPLTKDAPGPPDASKRLRDQGAQIVIALVQTPRLADAARLAAVAGADLAFQAGVVDPVADTEEGALLSGRVPAFRVKDKGRGLLKLTLHVDPSASTPGLTVPETAEMRQARAADLAKVLSSDKERLAGADDALRKLLEAKVRDLTARRDELLKPQAPPVGQSWADFTFVSLDDQLPEDPEVKAIFEAYTKQIGEMNLAAQKSKVCLPPTPGQPHYIGVQACRDCHAEAAAVYDGTRHPHAYQTLVDKKRQYDIECIRCHVLGYEQPGGVCRLDKVEGLANVQCESCHGMGSAHADSAGGDDMPVPKPGIDACLHCHTPDNDTRFSKEQYVSYYLPKILGPGHGLPSKKGARPAK